MRVLSKLVPYEPVQLFVVTPYSQLRKKVFHNSAQNEKTKVHEQVPTDALF